MDNSLIVAAAIEAKKLGCSPAAILAIVEVESAGRIFATVNGKQEPIIRFEGHWFDRRLTGPQQARARLQGLSAPKAGQVKNAASQTGRWKLLEKAMLIDRRAALESTSWGIGQVMGGHWKWLGYASVDALVNEARSGAAGQLRLMVAYIEKAGLGKALTTEDWVRFALGYNGPNAIKLGYDTKIQAAFHRWKAHDFDRPSEPVFAPLKLGSSGEAVTTLQTLLTSKGYPCGGIGIFDAKTEKAVRAFQKDHGLRPDGIVGPQTTQALQGKVSQQSLFTRLVILVRTLLGRIF